MKKGVSPVVAAVLLIAIAVIAAVAVWYWVSPLTAKPPTADTTQKSISVEECYWAAGVGNTYLDIRNTGGVAVTATFTVYNSADPTIATGATVTLTSLASGNVTRAQVAGAVMGQSTSYFLMAPGIPTATFTC